MKTPIQSFTVVGAFSALILKAFGFGVSTEQVDVAMQTYHMLTEIAPLLLGVLLDIKTMFSRIGETSEIVDKKFYEKQYFWTSLLALASTILSQRAYLDLEIIINKIQASWAAIAAVTANFVALYGAIRAKKTIL
jgi:hypothetical protein